MVLSKNFSLKEFTKSTSAIRAGIDNEPTKEHIRNIQLLVMNILQPLRDILGPIRITSGYRSEALNKLIKGSRRSQHCKGQAADIQFIKENVMNNKIIYDTIIDNGIIFDQMINEFDFSWIHISYNGKHNRNNIIEAYKENGITKYRSPKKQKAL